MRLNIAKLRTKGWNVQVNADEVMIFGDKPLTFVPALVDELTSMGLSGGDVDSLIGDFADGVETRLILRDAR